jgi:glutathione S-transferase
MSNDHAGLKLHMHPLASYCWKVLFALYETGTPFSSARVDGVPKDDVDYAALWPIAKMPLLQDGERIVPETSIIIEYLQDHHPGSTVLIPIDREIAREARLWDRFFDLYLHTPMQKLVSDHMRPDDAKDALGAQDARATLDTAYAMLDRRMADRVWAAGDALSIADCAAMPPLFYLEAIHPYRRAYPALAAYFQRLASRASAQRLIREAQPWFRYFPFCDSLEPRFVNAEAA